MKRYIKPSTETVDPVLTRDINNPNLYPSQVGDASQGKGTDNWEPEQDVDSGFDW
ncbi:MAG: hypothetical protein LUC26_06865 [Prevotella sp.]|nr:hypothetical protein [Prevotella sp.]